MKFKFVFSLVILVFFFVACGSDNNNESKNPDNSHSENDPQQSGTGNNNTNCSYGSYKCNGDNSYFCDNGWIFYASCDNGCDPVSGECNTDNNDNDESNDNDDNNGNDDGSNNGGKDNDKSDEIAEMIDQTRVAVKLTWKQGFKTRAEPEVKEGVMVDLDLHLIKKHSLEAETHGFHYTEGLLGTSTLTSNIAEYCPLNDSEPYCEKYWRHDDCWYGDPGYNYDGEESIQWNAKLLLDNSWGGGNYKNPEIIGLGTSGTDNILDDQYLVVVGYANCDSKYSDGTDHCVPSYTGEDAAYEVDARVEILVDGDEAPRSGTSDVYAAGTKDFKIKRNEWKAVAVIKWDSEDAIVTDSAMSDEGITTDPKNHPVFTYESFNAFLIPIWDAEEYRNHIETNEIGYCE